MLYLICSLPGVSFGQTWLWAHDGEGIGYSVSNGITVDDQGNTYMIGKIDGAASFSGTNYQGRGIGDIYIAKYDAQGNLQWVKLAGGDGEDIGYAIKYQSGFLYIAGSFSDTAYFETTPVISHGGTDAFVAKYDNNGNLVWVKSAGGPNADFASSVAVDDAGDVFIAGQYETSMRFGTSTISTANIYNESFYARYDNTGNLQWAKSTVGNGTNLITGLATYHNSSVYLTGFFSGSFAIDTGVVNSQTPSYDIFLTKVDENGALVWLKRAGSSFDDEAKAVCVDINGNPVITGFYSGSAYFGNDSVTNVSYSSVFVAKYDDAGNNLWVHAGKGNSINSIIIGFALTTDNFGNIFTTGLFQSNINFDGNAVSCPSRQLFLVSYSPTGNVRWLVAAGGTQTAVGCGVSVSAGGNVAVSGYYEYSCIFGNTSLTLADASNIFIADYAPPAVGITEVGDMQIGIYPNPIAAGNLLSLSASDGDTDYAIYDVTGQLVLCGKFNAIGKVITAGLNPGVYLIKCSNSSASGLAKLVVAE